jgi:hypothetical protein
LLTDSTPNWLKEIQADAKRQGLDKLTMEEILAEVAAARLERRERNKQPGADDILAR